MQPLRWTGSTLYLPPQPLASAVRPWVRLWFKDDSVMLAARRVAPTPPAVEAEMARAKEAAAAAARAAARKVRVDKEM